VLALVLKTVGMILYFIYFFANWLVDTAFDASEVLARVTEILERDAVIRDRYSGSTDSELVRDWLFFFVIA
jgi:hypothetical protein